MAANESSDRRLSDLHIAENTPLPSPKTLFDEVTRTAPQATVVFKAREAIQQILSDMSQLVSRKNPP